MMTRDQSAACLEATVTQPLLHGSPSLNPPSFPVSTQLSYWIKSKNAQKQFKKYFLCIDANERKTSLESWCKGLLCVLIRSPLNTSHKISSFTADCNCCLSNWDAWLQDWEFNYIIFHSMQMNRDGLILVSTMFFSTLASYHFASSFNHTVN